MRKHELEEIETRIVKIFSKNNNDWAGTLLDVSMMFQTLKSTAKTVLDYSDFNDKYETLVSIKHVSINTEDKMIARYYRHLDVIEFFNSVPTQDTAMIIAHVKEYNLKGIK